MANETHNKKKQNKESLLFYSVIRIIPRTTAPKRALREVITGELSVKKLLDIKNAFEEIGVESEEAFF